MKKVLLIACVMAIAVAAQSATIVHLTFDGATGVDIPTYTTVAGEIATTVTYTFGGLPGSARDYGLMPPDPGTPTGNYPDIVTPTTPGFQGGNALWTCTGNTGDSQQHIGWYITDSAIPQVTGDFTAEAIFMLAKIGTVTDPVVDSEYSLHNVFGTEMLTGNVTGVPGDGGAGWKFRVWPDGIIGGTGQLQLNCAGTNGGGETNVDGPNMAINTWYHVAAVYTSGTNTIELFLNGTSQGTTNPNWSDDGQNDWWVAAWPSNGANRGIAGWIDAVALSDTALAPTGFVLPTDATSGVDSWNLY
jgi:hypothetical protein